MGISREDVIPFENAFVDSFGEITLNRDHEIDPRQKTRFDRVSSQGELQKNGESTTPVDVIWSREIMVHQSSISPLGESSARLSQKGSNIESQRDAEGTDGDVFLFPLKISHGKAQDDDGGNSCKTSDTHILYTPKTGISVLEIKPGTARKAKRISADPAWAFLNRYLKV